MHTLLECPRWLTVRVQACAALGKNLEEENLSDLLLSSKENWMEIKKLSTSILKQKIEDENIETVVPCDF